MGGKETVLMFSVYPVSEVLSVARITYMHVDGLSGSLVTIYLVVERPLKFE